MKRAATVLASLMIAGAAHAATLAVNFTGSTNTSISGDLYGIAQADWNNLAGGGPTDTTETVTSDNGDTASATYSARGTWNMTGDPATVEESLFEGYLDDEASRGVEIILDMSSIATGTYTVTIFSSSDNAASGFSDISVNGSGNSVTALGPLGGLSTQHATTVITGVTGDLSIVTPGKGAGPRGSISGMTIEYTQIPEPSSTALLGLGGLAMIMRRRK